MSVTFRDEVLIKLIPKSKGLYGNNLLWYSEADFQEFRSRDNYIVDHMQNDSQFTRIHIQQELGECTRGLEGRIPGVREKWFMRKFALAAVLNEQQQQKSQNICDPLLIAKVYSRVCLSATDDALLIGASDEKYVHEDVLPPAYDIHSPSMNSPLIPGPPLTLKRKQILKPKRLKAFQIERKRTVVPLPSSQKFEIQRSRTCFVDQ